MTHHKEVMLFTGGARSGKSDMALRWAEAKATQRYFIATARAEDEEMTSRIARHQLQRGVGWHTLEVPLHIVQAMQDAHTTGAGVIVVDCITMWLSNFMDVRLSEKTILERAETFSAWLNDAPLPMAIVTGELGMGMVPQNALGRSFRDMHGVINQMLASVASTVVLACCGLPVLVKGKMPDIW